MKGRVRTLLVGLTAIIMSLTAGTLPASAASTAWVYLVFPSWLGNCPGSSVHAIQASVGNTWSTNWDAGDDIVYGKVYVGTNQTLSYNLMCRLGSRTVGYQPGSVTIKPTGTTRTIFAGPSGVRYQNY